MRRFIVSLTVVLAATAGAVAWAAPTDPVEKLVDEAVRAARGSRLPDRTVASLTERAGALPPEDLRKALELLADPATEGRSLPEVRALLHRLWAERAYGAEAAARWPNLLERLGAAEGGARLELLADALKLRDLRLAKEVALGEKAAVVPLRRGRAAIALGCLITWGAGDEAVNGALAELFADPDPGVRALAIRAGMMARLDAAFPAAVARLTDAETADVEDEGEARTLRPGAEALVALGDLTRLDVPGRWEDFAALPKEEQAAVAEQFAEWWRKHGERFPVPGFREASFRTPAAAREEGVVDEGSTAVTLQLWAGIDRTRVRTVVDELSWFATGRYDWRIHGRFGTMLQGMRTGMAEGYFRRHPIGSPWIFARKDLGCYVLTFQPLHDGALLVRLSFLDPAG